MRYSPFTALLDANVLYPAPLRDLLMQLALTGVYRARWSAQIHNEWKRKLLKNRPDLPTEKLNRTSELMDLAVPDALVTDYEPLIEGLLLSDPDDRHVLAAAIQCNVSVIVSYNLKDFPFEMLKRFGIEAVHPDEFMADIWDLDQAALLQAAQQQRASLKNPPCGVEDYLGTLQQQRLPETVKLLSQFKTFI